MALIEVDTDVYFDTTLQWYQQSNDCVALGRALMEETPKSINYEPCIDGQQRMLDGVWETTTATGTFDMSVIRHYEYPAMTKAFEAKAEHDTVTVNQIS